MSNGLRQVLPGRTMFASGLAIGLCLLLNAAANGQYPAPAMAPAPTAAAPGPKAASGGWSIFDDEPLLAPLKNQPVFGDWTYTFGGEFRYRNIYEHNRLRPQGTTPTDYNQWRVAPFLELKTQGLTAFVQAIDASTFNSEIATLPPDVNRADLLQYYVDAQLWDSDEGTFNVRVGRQFLKYGSQYLVSPLPWANTYRNFEGVRGYWQSELWDVDAFAVHPVNGAAVPLQWRPTSHDIPDWSVWFSGIYASRKKFCGGAFDSYWLWNQENQPVLLRQDGDRHTFGARYWGTQPLPLSLPATYLWDLEGGWQVGSDNFQVIGSRTVNAGFFGATGAMTLTEVPWTPTIKGLFWWGSGDQHRGNGSINTFSTLYSFVHPYWGIIDNLNGSNLLQYSAQFILKPTKKMTVYSQFHWFDKASAADSIYNVSGVPFGGASTNRHIGNELDLFGAYLINANLELQLGYAHFWYGSAVDEQPLIRRGDANGAYVMTTWTF